MGKILVAHKRNLGANGNTSSLKTHKIMNVSASNAQGKPKFISKYHWKPEKNGQ